MPAPLDLNAVRARFPGLQRTVAGRPAVFTDGPAGSQVPASVAAAVADYLLHRNANHGGAFATSRETDAMVADARAAAATLFGAGDPEEVVFGANMTTLAFHLASALQTTWRAGDEVVVTDSDHDANVTPWVLAARAAGATVRALPVRRDGTLDLDAAATLLGPRTRFLAVGAASNLTGTVHPVRELVAKARTHGALTFVDAVHFAPHLRMDVRAWGCDFAACSAYKFFGPHLGLLWGRGELLAKLTPRKVRPSPAHGAERWQTGTACFEAIAGLRAAVDYLGGLGGGGALGPALDRAFAAIAAHEQVLGERLLRGLLAIPGLRVVGIDDPVARRRHCPTFSFVHPRRRPEALHVALAERGVFSWAGNSYALALTTALGLEPDGVLRLGLLHYNTAEEIDRVLAMLRELLAG